MYPPSLSPSLPSSALPSPTSSRSPSSLDSHSSSRNSAYSSASSRTTSRTSTYSFPEKPQAPARTQTQTQTQTRTQTRTLHRGATTIQYVLPAQTHRHSTSNQYALPSQRPHSTSRNQREWRARRSRRTQSTNNLSDASKAKNTGPRFYSTPLCETSADPQTPLQAFGLEEREPSIMEDRKRRGGLRRRMSMRLDHIKEDLALQIDPQAVAAKQIIRKRESAFFDGLPVSEERERMKEPRRRDSAVFDGLRRRQSMAFEGLRRKGGMSASNFGASKPAEEQQQQSVRAPRRHASAYFEGGRSSVVPPPRQQQQPKSKPSQPTLRRRESNQSAKQPSHRIVDPSTELTALPALRPVAEPPPSFARHRDAADAYHEHKRMSLSSSMSKPLSMFSMENYRDAPRRLGKKLQTLGSDLSQRKKRVVGGISGPSFVGSSMQV